MARNPVWADVCRGDAGRFAPREVCKPGGGCCTTPATEVVITVGTDAAKQTAGEAAKGAIKSAAPIAAAIVLAESIYTAVEFRQGKISKHEAISRVIGSFAGGVGSVGGAAAGAAFGTAVFPVVGTAIGGFVGSVLGGLGGRFGARRAMALKSTPPAGGITAIA